MDLLIIPASPNALSPLARKFSDGWLRRTSGTGGYENVLRHLGSLDFPPKCQRTANIVLSLGLLISSRSTPRDHAADRIGDYVLMTRRLMHLPSSIYRHSVEAGRPLLPKIIRAVATSAALLPSCRTIRGHTNSPCSPTPGAPLRRPERSSSCRLPVSEVAPNCFRIAALRFKDTTAVAQFDRCHAMGRPQQVVQHNRRR
jgi:hypothetical protein